MNNFEVTSLPSSINLETTNLSIDIFYIGTFIGLCGGFITMCILCYFKYKKMELDTLPIEITI